MADFEMRNFHEFPLEKSSYDLKLEVLEELDQKEALELMKANNGFRAIYLKDPWRVIGRHVHWIHFTSSDDTLEIYKLPKSEPLHCDPLFHLPLLKKIKSCEEFSYRRGDLRTRSMIDTARKMLSNLDSIGKWGYGIRDLESFKECFSNFRGQITDLIYMNLTWYSGEENDPTFSVISKVFETQLGKCKQVSLQCFVDQYSIFCKLFSKTMIKKIVFWFDVRKQFSATGFEMVIRWILCNGIPSQNREAEIYMSLDQDPSQSVDDTYHSFGNLLSAFPGMQRMPDGKNVRFYRRKIDNERDCIYELRWRWFIAKYVPSQAQ